MKYIRKGMRVCSVYEPDRVFTVDRSLLPGRVYHEKGATRWYTKRELLPAKAGKKAAKPLSTAKESTLQRERSSAFLAVLTSPTKLQLRCAECGKRVERKNKARPLRPGELPFCNAAERTRFWKRKNLLPKKISTVLRKSSTEPVQKSEVA